MPPIDPVASAGVFVALLLGGCIAVLIGMRDTAHSPPHAVWRWTWCPRHERAVMAEFMERVQTGLATRSVTQCPLRRPGEQCGEGCRWEPTRSP